MEKTRSFLLACMMIPLLAACTPVGVALGVGAEVGSAAMSERGLVGSADDFRIKSQVLALLVDHEGDLFSDVIVLAHEGELVLAGNVATIEDRSTALQLVKTVPGVAHLVDHLDIQPALSFTDFAHDAMINARIRSGMLMDGGVLSVNFSIDTLAGTVYMVGIAQDRTEHQRVVAIVRGTPYVKEVVDLTKLKSTPGKMARYP